jgi:hypothetical protein
MTGISGNVFGANGDGFVVLPMVVSRHRTGLSKQIGPPLSSGPMERARLGVGSYYFFAPSAGFD